MTDDTVEEASDMDATTSGRSSALSSKQVRLLLAEGVDLCARLAHKKTTVLDADCDPDALERRHRGTLRCACPRDFDSALEFEAHYASRHRLACLECRAAFPTEHLLELHIAESHDPMFAARPSSAESPKYACVVEGCRQRFASWSDRRAHAWDVHRYYYNAWNTKIGMLVLQPVLGTSAFELARSLTLVRFDKTVKHCFCCT